MALPPVEGRKRCRERIVMRSTADCYDRGRGRALRAAEGGYVHY
jgi:hypothetical protein